MSDPETVSGSTVILMLIGFFIIFFIFMGFLFWLIARFGGWQALAKQYPALQPQSGETWKWQSGMVNKMTYSNILMLTANAQGLTLDVFFLFKIGHPALFIPWQEFQNAEVGDSPYGPQVQAQIGSAPGVTLRLPVVVFEESEGRKFFENR